MCYFCFVWFLLSLGQGGSNLCKFNNYIIKKQCLIKNVGLGVLNALLRGILCNTLRLA